MAKAKAKTGRPHPMTPRAGVTKDPRRRFCGGGKLFCGGGKIKTRTK